MAIFAILYFLIPIALFVWLILSIQDIKQTLKSIERKIGSVEVISSKRLDN